MFFVMLGRLPLVEPDEGRNAEVAREMLAGGDWLIPRYDGFPYLDKPPVLFWLEAVSFRVFGVSEFAARFPSAAAALMTVLLTWFLACQMFDGKSGIDAGVVFAVAPLAVIFSRFVIFDMPLTLFETAALICFWQGETSSGRRRAYGVAFFALMGIATLVKGPVGFLIPLLVVTVYSLLRRRLRSLSGLPWGWGLLVFCAIVLPWFIAVSLRYPSFPRYALLEESLRRFLTPQAHRSGSLLYYIPVYLAGFLPWSFFLLFAAFGKLKKWRRLWDKDSSPLLFLIVWAGVVFVFFSFSHSKLPGYFLPALVPLSILMGAVWSRSESGLGMKVPDWMTAGFAALIFIGLLLLVAPVWMNSASLHSRLSRKLPAEVLAYARPSMIYSGIILMALGVLARDLLGRVGQRAPAWLAFALLSLAFPLLLLRCAEPLGFYAAHNSSRRLARTILSSPQKDLPVYGYYYFRTSLPFYLERPVGLVTTGAGELTSNFVASRWPNLHNKATAQLFPRLANTGCWPGGGPIVVREREWLGGPGPWPVLVMLRNDHVSGLVSNAKRLDPLWSGWKFSVWQFSPRGR
jgi:Dolichyl-phosphate-mannose-protein mannosyltransferase